MARSRDDDFTDEPRRPRDDDYEPRPPKQLTGMDGLFANTNIVVLILFACLCNGIALILGIVGLVTCTDPKAKQNAMTVTIIGGIITALYVIGQVAHIASR